MGQGVPRFWPKWVMTVEAMIEEEVLVRASCRTCNTMFRVDLKSIRIVKGRHYSLIDKTAPCRIYDCPGECFFLYSPREGTPFRPLTS